MVDKCSLGYVPWPRGQKLERIHRLAVFSIGFESALLWVLVIVSAYQVVVINRLGKIHKGWSNWLYGIKQAVMDQVFI